MMSTTIRYTAAEHASFKLVPETCPAVEAAIDRAFAPLTGTDAFVQEVLAKYGLEPGRRLSNAIEEVLGRLLFQRKAALRATVLFEGTSDEAIHDAEVRRVYLGENYV
uniref:hypothetical protein n=1 Tax=uncultured Bradyrhizobium sp. TaxID=199684 RepID=UPI00262F23CE